jgi:hypothetical protein
MATPGSTMKILLIRSWIHPLAPLRAALQVAGLDPRFTRVDIEPALNAALSRGGHDVAIHDPATPGLPRTAVEACLRAHRIDIPLIELVEVEDVAERIDVALAARRS